MQWRRLLESRKWLATKWARVEWRLLSAQYHKYWNITSTEGMCNQFLIQHGTCGLAEVRLRLLMSPPLMWNHQFPRNHQPVYVVFRYLKFTLYCHKITNSQDITQSVYVLFGYLKFTFHCCEITNSQDITQSVYVVFVYLKFTPLSWNQARLVRS